ncbi:MAG: lysophospholipase [Methylobacteriaceae bacterium]|jgi:lysophospholipase|nr:lysophospholipase [Methylobacteriaceae bacterium]
MEIFETPDNRAPPGAIVSPVRTVDDVLLRVVRWVPEGEPLGTVAILQGRTEFVEKYFEVAGELLARGFVVVAMDWRGQGLSDRDLKDSRKGHVDDFAFFERDLEALQQQVLQFLCPEPWFALGHSMAGAILLAQARARRSPFARMVLTGPMIDIAGLRFPRLVRAVMEGLDMVGLGTAYVPGGSPKATLECGFEGNDLTSDPVRFARLAGILEVAPQLGLGGPTVGWLNAAFRLMDEFADAEYPRRTFTPTLVIGAGADRVVSAPALERFATRLKVGRLITIPDAQHEILVERDHIRAQFWAAFDAFIPGQHSSLAALEADAEAKRASHSRRRWFWRRQAA